MRGLWTIIKIAAKSSLEKFILKSLATQVKWNPSSKRSCRNESKIGNKQDGNGKGIVIQVYVGMFTTTTGLKPFKYCVYR